MRGLESQPQEGPSDATRSEDVARIAESDPFGSREDLDNWEKQNFGGDGGAIDDKEPVRFIE